MKASEDGAIRDERAKGAEATAVKNTRKRLRSAFSYLNLLRAVNPGVLDYVLLLVGVFSSIAAGVPFPLMAIVIGQLVDQLNSASCSSETVSDSYDYSLVNRVLLTVYIAIANFALIYIASGAWSLFGERLVRRLRYAYLYVLLQQEIEFFETLSTGDVASRLDTDLLTIQAGVSEKVGIVLQSVSYFVTAYIVAFIRDAKLAGILFSLVPAYIIMAAAGNHFSAKYRAAVDEKMAPAISLASESLSHIKLIKSFRAGWRIERIFDGYLAATRPAAIGMVVTAAVQMGLLYFIAYSANALAFSQGGNQIADAMQQNDASVTLGAVYAIMTTLIDSSYIISQVAPFLTIFAAASQTGERILDTIHRKPSIDATTGAGGVMMETIEGNIEFKDIFFRYPSRPEMIVLNKLNLHIAVGKMTGIVGLSGSGKSTIAALIQRFYDPGEGVVAIDGHDLRDINLRSLRGHIGYVEQNPVLFDRSILENIAHGLVGSSRPEHRALQRCLTNGDLPELADAVRKGGDITQLAMQSAELDHTLSLIRASATQAGLDSFIAGFPHGLATSVGPSGSRLSGGQRQRVALARTLIRNPSILILDEATAALDSTTEAQIREAIESLPGQRTIVCIAHRLSTIKNAHNIVVMRAGGQIIETGSYQDLMNLDGTFASMVRSQAISGQVEGDAITALGTSETPKCKLVEDEPKVGQSETSETSSTGDDGVPHSSQRSDKAEKSNLFPIFLRIVKMSRSQILIAIGFFSAIVVGGSHAGEAVIFANAVGQLAPCYTASQIRSSASFYGLLFFVLALVEFFANTLTASSFGRVSDQLVIKIRSLTLRALLRRGVQWHESNNRTPGSLMKYVSADAAAMSGLTGTILGVTVSVLVTLVAGIILAHVATWKIALVLTACVPLIFVSGFLRLRLQARFAERHAKAFADSVATATESVTHIRTVSAFALQEEVASTFNRSLRGPYRATLKSIAFGNVWLAASFSIGSFVKALAFWWGGRLIANKEISQIQYFIAEVALLSAAQTSGQLFSLSPDVTKAVVAARQVFDLICPDGKTERLQGEHQQPPKTDIEKSAGVRTPMNLPQMTNRDIGTSVSFSNVRFSYPSRPDTVILQDITLDIPAGSFVAIVGTTGAGKSTIMSLLQKLYRPTSGTITLDGYNITRGGTQQKESEEEEDEQENDIPIWDDVALVPQDAALFSGSVAFNIGLGARANSDATESEIEAAARLANIHDTIKSLPDGYETLCGPTGSQFFSGGQKQRLCIARALLRKPRLLLLDEPSSAMDAESEGLWERTLEDLMEVGENGQRRVTVVAIAHRLRTITKADKIFIVDNGRVLDSGTHNELVSRCEKYRVDVVHQSLE